MEDLDPQHVKTSRVFSMHPDTSGQAGSICDVEIRYAELRTRDYVYNLIAYSPHFPGEILGYTSFVDFGHVISECPEFIELKGMKVDKGHFQKGLGALLIDESRKLAREIGKQIILTPERPGWGTLEKYRIKDFPLTTEQLREMYLRHGFREFNEEEVETYARRIDRETFISTLWHEGFDPRVKRRTKKKSTRTLTETALFDRFTHEELLERYSSIFRKLGQERAIQSNLISHREWVRTFLIEVME